MNGQPLGGRSITVNEARPQPFRGFGGGGRGGYEALRTQLTAKKRAWHQLPGLALSKA